jgi:Tol biopolymer transport system component
MAKGISRGRSVSVVSVLVFVVVGLAASTVFASTSLLNSNCPNDLVRERQGSTYLPDCRAYELVTPANKGGAQDSFAFGAKVDQAIPAENGEAIALNTFAKFGPNPGSGSGPFPGSGDGYVFSRGPNGWQMMSVYPPDSGQTGYAAELFSPDLSQIGVRSSTFTNFNDQIGGLSFGVGVPGGPYQVLATTPFTSGIVYDNHPDRLMGSSADFTHFIFESVDSNLLPAATGTDEEASDLYEYDSASRQLQVTNVTSGGSLVSICGATLGGGVAANGDHAQGAVSSDGSKVFFTAPNPHDKGKAGCYKKESPENGEPSVNPPQLYMRVDGSETVEVSSPDAGVSDVRGAQQIFYVGASASGSNVFFTTKTELTPDDTTHAGELYEYDTESRSLTRISRGESGVAEGEVENNGQPLQGGVAVSKDGTTVYFTAHGQLAAGAPDNPTNGSNLYRYDTVAKTTSYIATVESGESIQEEPYVTPNGRFLLFASKGIFGEGHFEPSVEERFDAALGHNEIYRYDDVTGSLICVSCSGGVATGEATLPAIAGVDYVLATPDHSPPVIPMSDDGRYAFFSTNERLVARDTNSTEGSILGVSSVPLGEDVYEWEQDGTGGCEASEGCIYIITSGTSDAAGSVLLGASRDGRDVFFATHARLVSQDTDFMGDIYDARMGGGFMESPQESCGGEGCQGAPNRTPTLASPFSSNIGGSGNIVPFAVKNKAKGKKVNATARTRHHDGRKRKRKRRTGSSANAQKLVGVHKFSGGR